jgi:hypothetical protein
MTNQFGPYAELTGREKESAESQASNIKTSSAVTIDARSPSFKHDELASVIGQAATVALLTGRKKDNCFDPLDLAGRLEETSGRAPPW